MLGDGTWIFNSKFIEMPHFPKIMFLAYRFYQTPNKNKN